MGLTIAPDWMNCSGDLPGRISTAILPFKRKGPTNMDDPRGHPRNVPGLSRRQFLKGSSLTAAATALSTAPLSAFPTVEESAQESVPVGPGPVKIQLNVNGKMMTQSIEPRV